MRMLLAYACRWRTNCCFPANHMLFEQQMHLLNSAVITRLNKAYYLLRSAIAEHNGPVYFITHSQHYLVMRIVWSRLENNCPMN